MASRAHAVRGRAIAILMNVERVLLAGRESFNVGDHLHRLPLLSEAHYSVALLPGSRWSQPRFRPGPSVRVVGARWFCAAPKKACTLAGNFGVVQCIRRRAVAGFGKWSKIVGSSAEREHSRRMD